MLDYSCHAGLRRWIVTGFSILMTASQPAHAVGENAYADIRLRDGKEIGRVKLVETTAGVLVRIKLKGLPPGLTVSVHENGGASVSAPAYSSWHRGWLSQRRARWLVTCPA
jgi:Cu/Zn superoxide dismutase